MLGHLGTHYPATQRLDAVWEAVRRINDGGGPRVDRLRFVGDLHPDLRRTLRERGLEPLVEATGFLPHRDALAALARSSLLLAPGPYRADEITRGHVPAKLAECLATDLPILYVGDLDARCRGSACAAIRAAASSPATTSTAPCTHSTRAAADASTATWRR